MAGSQPAAITVSEGGQLLSYRFEDLMRFHGFGFPGGVTHGFKVMQLALPLLSPNEAPERREISIATPFSGPGARDAFEMVTRCLTEGRYKVDPTLAKFERGEVLKGYVFNLTYRERTAFLQIKEGHVREEFILLGRKASRTTAEEAKLSWLKQEMTDRLLPLPADSVYECLGLTYVS